MKILIIQLSKMGDIIQSFPLISNILVNEPNAQITYLHSELFSEVLTLSPQIIPFPLNLDKIIDQSSDLLILKDSIETKNLINSLSHQDFDLIINLNISPMAKQLLHQIQSLQKRGFGSNLQADLEFEHMILAFQKSRYLDTLNLVDIFLKFSPFNNQLNSANLSNNTIKNNITLQLGSRNAKRHPSISDFALLANLLTDMGKTITLTGSKSEEYLFEHFIQKINNKKAIINMMGKTKLQELKELISNSDFLITPDTGTMHIASLTNTPIFAFFAGSAYPYETLGYRKNIYTCFHLPDQIPCYPCPENTPCPNHLICHTFDMKAIAQFITENSKATMIYETVSDHVGQYLLPLIKTDISDKQLYAYFWRIFIAQYFYHQKITPGMIHHQLIINEAIKKRFFTLIQRELLMAERLNINTNIDEISQNFEFLAPYLIFLIIHKTETPLKEHFLSFIQDIHNIF